MIRAARLVVSRPMYAFDPTTFAQADWSGYTRTVRAVWFKRRKGVLTATMGSYSLWGTGTDLPADDTYEAWVAWHGDNRYGGSHLASWDGTALLNSDQPVSPDEAALRVEFLGAMLAGFPEVPAGYDGWYEFAKGSK